MILRATKAVAALAGLAALAAWVCPPPAEAKEWPGPYDHAARRYYADEERDYQALGYDTRGAGRSGVSWPYTHRYPYAAGTPYNYYGASSQPAPARDNAARVRVIVPADAKVWFDNRATTQAGAERWFESPALTPGRQYTYDIKAQWRDQDGKEVTRTGQVDVSANASVTVDLTR
jgi:uncharacterized protein (TIGR03000 family)